MSTETGSDEPSGASLSYQNILEREMEEALQGIARPATGVFLSGLAAGLNLSFGALFMGMALTFSGGFESQLVQQIALGSLSSIAFLFVVLGQTELFTAHSTMAVLPVLDRRASLSDLGGLWGATYVSNLLGCMMFAGLIATLRAIDGYRITIGVRHPCKRACATTVVDDPSEWSRSRLAYGNDDMACGRQS